MTHEVGEPRPWADESERHLAACGECAAWARHRVRQVRALASLAPAEAPAELARRVAAERETGAAGIRAAAHLGLLDAREAPTELDGLVVAAMHAGHRQDRATAHLCSHLGEGLRAPAELERRLAAATDPPSLSDLEAASLERGVAGDLEDLPRALTSRMTGKLSRRPAPAQLAGALQGPGSRRWPLGLAAVLSAATLVAAWSGGRWWLEGASDPSSAPTVLSFEVRRLESAAELEQLGLAGFVDHGLLTAARAAPGAAFGARPSTRRAVGSATSGANSTGGSLPAAPGVGRLTPADLPLLAAVAGASESVEHRGVRRVFLANPALTAAPSIEYREEVGSDGLGAFFVRPIEVISPPLDPNALDLFLMLQEERQGFQFRYRDFRIADIDLFMARYQVAVRPKEEQVAGRACQVLDVRLREQAEREYVLAVDPKTGLLLRYEETFQTGELVARVEFESIELEPDFSDGALTGGPSQWAAFDPDHSPPPQVTFDLLRPKLPPEGYQLAQASSRVVLGKPWLRLVYQDGLEKVVFVHDGPDTSGGPLPGTDSVGVFTLGAWTVVEGEIAGHTVFVMGKVDQQDLLDMLQSALE
jgi:hypothetical protein